MTGSGTIIDGTSQPFNGYTGSSPKIIIDGSTLGSGSGISISGTDCAMFGLYVTGFPNHGVYISAYR
jgi:hypothetical protein